MKNKIIVTGGSGFIGTNIIEFFKDKHEVLNLDIESPRNTKHKKYWREINILDAKSLNNVFLQFQPDFVIHMAARTDLDGKSLEEYRANIKGVENVILATNNTPSIKKIIFASSRLVCEIGYEPKDEFDYKPSTIYGESKIIGEKIVRASKIENATWIIVRPTSLWGPWFGAPYKNFFDIIERKLYFHAKGYEIHKKFGFVLNCVYILNALLKDDTLNKKTVYLSDFKELEVKIWADMISNCFHNTKVKQIPYFFLKIFSVLGDVSKYLGVKNPPLTTFRLNNLITQMSYNTLDVQNIVEELPFTLEQGTNITYEWLIKKNG